MKKRGIIDAQRRSFAAAGRGIGLCLSAEPHMRFHTAAAVAVLCLSPFFELDAVRYAVLLLTFALVIAAEMVNTALERITDVQSPTYSAHAAAVKDIAAGAVLVCAIFAVGVGVCLFHSAEGWARVIRFFGVSLLRQLGGLALIALLVVYVRSGPAALCRRWTRRRQPNHSERNSHS